ncbi:MAG: DUF3021 domain-containing protein [Atopobiaceae bacterium]|nr:DUF3021 domain-containing protein [Atopobiaceae bacterium]
MCGATGGRASCHPRSCFCLAFLITIVNGFVRGGGDLILTDNLLAATGSEAGALLAQMLISGAYGAIPMAGTIIYPIDSWGLLKQALVHYVSYTLAFMIIGVPAGWVQTPAESCIMAGIFLVCHGVIWLIMYARYKAEARELNALLEQVRQDDTTIDA